MGTAATDVHHIRTAVVPDDAVEMQEVQQTRVVRVAEEWLRAGFDQSNIEMLEYGDLIVAANGRHDGRDRGIRTRLPVNGCYRLESDRGSPKDGKTLFSKRIIAQIRSPVRVRT